MTEKEEKFVRYLSMTGEKQKSAIRAGYSPKTAHVIASENLKKPKIQEALARRRERHEKKLDELEDILLEKTKSMMAFDPLDALDASGNPKSMDQWPKELRDAVVEIKVVSLEDGNTGMLAKFSDRTKAMALASKITQIEKPEAGSVTVGQGLNLNINFMGANGNG